MINRLPVICWQTLIWCDRPQPPALSSCSCTLALTDFESSGWKQSSAEASSLNPPRCQIVHFISRLMFPPAAFRGQKLQGCRSDGFPHVIRDFIWPPSEGTSWETDRANKFESRNEFPLQGGTLEVAQKFERRRHTEGSQRLGSPVNTPPLGLPDRGHGGILAPGQLGRSSAWEVDELEDGAGRRWSGMKVRFWTRGAD